ncbi:hypothetical protein ACFVTC_22475 [Streptomyces sp. NPDC057950]|uniref:hypothetical protein n=1 Tax=Streptomyces sp. NPDC057950 TaxID=3346288 RepID=UPI0036E12114
MAMLLLVGCRPAKGATEDRGAAAEDGLTFTYHRHSGDGMIDQTLSIRNAYMSSVSPVLAFTALDRHRHPLPGVRVRTVFGSDSGRLEVPYGVGYDILRFSGSGEHQVFDVRVSVTRVTTAKTQADTLPPSAETLDAAGRVVSKFSRFAAVRVTNPEEFAVSARIAYLVYDQPAEGETQQAVFVIPIGTLVRIPARSMAIVEVTGDAARAVAKYSGGPAVSVKAYNSEAVDAPAGPVPPAL